jgi:hypothetical protein
LARGYRVALMPSSGRGGKGFVHHRCVMEGRSRGSAFSPEAVVTCRWVRARSSCSLSCPATAGHPVTTAPVVTGSTAFAGDDGQKDGSAESPAGRPIPEADLPQICRTREEHRKRKINNFPHGPGSAFFWSRVGRFSVAVLTCARPKSPSNSVAYEKWCKPATGWQFEHGESAANLELRMRFDYSIMGGTRNRPPRQQ